MWGDKHMAKDSAFWDRIADKYARDPIADEASYQHKLEMTRGYFQPEMRVLEFGCGTGSTALLHAPFVSHIQAIDISARMIEIAREKAQAEGIENVTFEQSGIEGLSAPEESFDMILGLSVLHLVDDRQGVLARVHRLLKPGGWFISSTVCLADRMGYLRFILPVAQLVGAAPRVAFFRLDELKQNIVDADFSIDHFWQPAPDKAAFIVAQKPA